MTRGVIIGLVLVGVGVLAAAVWYFGRQVGRASDAIAATNRNVDELQGSTIGRFLLGV